MCPLSSVLKRFLLNSSCSMAVSLPKAAISTDAALMAFAGVYSGNTNGKRQISAAGRLFGLDIEDYEPYWPTMLNVAVHRFHKRLTLERRAEIEKTFEPTSFPQLSTFDLGRGFIRLTA